MASSTLQTLCVVQGSTDIRDLFVFEDDVARALVLPQTAGDILYVTVIDTEAADAAVISLVSTSISLIEKIDPQTGADTGKALIKFAPSDTTGLTLSSTRYKWDAWLVKDTSGERIQIVPLSPFVVLKRGTVIP